MLTGKKVKACIMRKNIYVNDILIRIKKVKQNRVTDLIINKTKDIDSFKNYDEFADIIRNYAPKGVSLTKQCYGGEALLYGHLSALYDYAGLGNPNVKAFPKLEHGVDTYASALKKEDIAFVGNFIFQGGYKKEQIHSIDPYKPVFVIGPYIHYAREIYSQSEMKQIKEQLGKTLLVYPFHCYEFSTGKYDDAKFVDYVMKELAKDFNTVLVSVYWNDVSDPIYEKFALMGAKLVSSGFRGDSNFIRRQKTIMMLADAVCGNSFGTHIGYSMCLNKPYLYIDTGLSYVDEKHIRLDSELEHHKKMDNELRKAFSDFDATDEDKVLQKQLYIKYWGGNKALKSQEEIKLLLLLGEKITRDSHGFPGKFRKVVQGMLETPNCISEKMYEQLIEAVKKV